MSLHVWLGYLLKSPCDVEVQKERVNERDESHPVNGVSCCAEDSDRWRITGVARFGRSHLYCLWEPSVFPRLSSERRRPEWNPCRPMQQLPHPSKVDSRRNRSGMSWLSRTYTLMHSGLWKSRRIDVSHFRRVSHIFLLKDHTDEGLLLKSCMKYRSNMERSSGKAKSFELMAALGQQAKG